MAANNRASDALRGAIILLAGAGLVWALWPSAATERSETVTVFAAASLREVMQDLGAAFSSQRTSRLPSDQDPSPQLSFNLAGSNVLARQIVATSGADVFVSADAKWMDHVEAAGRLHAGSRRAICSNTLVVIAHGSTRWKMDAAADLLKLPYAHLAIADPEAVPAGRYARAFLESTSVSGRSLWAVSRDRIAPTADVRAALSLVESDPSTVGIVYRTDTAASESVRIIYEVPQDSTPPILYQAALIDRVDSASSARDFFTFLFSPRARDIFIRHGFVPIADGAVSE